MRYYFKNIICVIFLIINFLLVSAFHFTDPMLRLKVSSNARYLVKENGDPFFWLGDTAWQLFMKLNQEEAKKYLADRMNKKFTVIQSHLLGFSITDKNAYGVVAFKQNDFNQPNEDYWKHADYIIDNAESSGLYMALLPAWARSYIEESKAEAEGEKSKGKPALSDTVTAYSYGLFLGRRYKAKQNIIWILGGDIWGRKDAVYENLARGLTDGAANGNPDNILISFHPPGGTYRPPATSTSEFYHNKSWLDFNMIQSGHSVGNKNYERITDDYNLALVKPTLDSEPCYEQHPVQHSFYKGVFSAWHIRRRAYWSLFAGAFGFTYGGNGIWQMDKPDRIHAKSHFNYYWYEALNYEGAKQMTYVRALMESRPFITPQMIPDQSILKSQSGSVDDRIQCARADNYSYLMIYTTNGSPFNVDISKMQGKNINAWWYNPRDGRNYNTNNKVTKKPLKISTKKSIQNFIPPGTNMQENDWVLILDDASEYFSPPGQRQIK